MAQNSNDWDVSERDNSTEESSFSRELYPWKIRCLTMDCIVISCNPEKNTMTSVREQRISRIWSKATYSLRELVEDSGNQVMYYHSHGPERAFVSEELMLIPEKTELPPDYVQKW